MVDERPTENRAEESTSILLVEDNPLDVRSTIRAARKLELAHSVEVVTDGQAALDHLRQTQTGPAPVGLVLLDLNLPGTDGREVLEEIKANPDLKSIPVVVLTTSGALRDIEDCYEVGANSYVKKPVDSDAFLTTIRSLKKYWIDTSSLPSRASASGASLD